MHAGTPTLSSPFCSAGSQQDVYSSPFAPIDSVLLSEMLPWKREMATPLYAFLFICIEFQPPHWEQKSMPWTTFIFIFHPHHFLSSFSGRFLSPLFSLVCFLTVCISVLLHMLLCVSPFLISSLFWHIPVCLLQYLSSFSFLTPFSIFSHIFLLFSVSCFPHFFSPARCVQYLLLVRNCLHRLWPKWLSQFFWSIMKSRLFIDFSCKFFFNCTVL